MLENTRFHPGEEKNDMGLAAEMAALGDVFVNDAFSAAHRAHASTEGIAKLLPKAAGRLMEAELKAQMEESKRIKAETENYVLKAKEQIAAEQPKNSIG